MTPTAIGVAVVAAGSTPPTSAGGFTGVVALTFIAGRCGAKLVSGPSGDASAIRSERALRALVMGPAITAVNIVAASVFAGAAPSAQRIALLALAHTVLLGASVAAMWRPATTTAGSRHDGSRGSAAEGPTISVEADQVVIDLRDPAPRAGSPACVLPPFCRLFKRTLDVSVAAVAGALMLPVVVVAAAAIRLDSPGGALFRHTRVGANGRLFTLYKLRTMRENNDDSEHRAFVAALIRREGMPLDGAMFKLTADARVTRVGRWLRRFSVDEIPQLWNVVRGDMSLVGPRPPLPAEAELYDDHARQRLLVKPGMTGLWQVSGRGRLDFGQMVDLDIEYWRSWSPLRDLAILVRTPKAALVDRETA